MLLVRILLIWLFLLLLSHLSGSAVRAQKKRNEEGRKKEGGGRKEEGEGRRREKE